MSLLAEKIPNHPLTGSELKEYVCHLLAKELDTPELSEAAIADIHKRMSGDFAFAHNAAYPVPGITVTAKYFIPTIDGEPSKYHLSADFQFINSMMQKHRVEVSFGPGTLPDGAVGVVTAFRRTIRVDNPNLVRVHLGLQIQRLVNHAAKPGETIGKAEMVDVLYDPTDYPPLPEPEETDISREVAREWGVAATKPVYVAPVVETWPVLLPDQPATVEDLKEKFRKRKTVYVEATK